MTQPNDSNPLADLARGYGIADHYYDIWGARHEVTAETMRCVLAAMGVAVDTHKARARSLSALHARYWCRPCDPVLVIRNDRRSASWDLRVPSTEEQDAGWSISWTLDEEDGRQRERGVAGQGCPVLEHSTVDGVRYIRLQVTIPEELPLGYYRFSVILSQGARQISGTSVLIVAPLTCYVPRELAEGRRTWGLWVQLYSLRSKRNWGAGDFTDLESLIRWSGGSLGAGVVGVNPLHALKNRRPHHISPYSPHSRGFLNEMYLDVERVPEYRRSLAAQRHVAGDAFTSRLESFRKSDWVDYEGIHRAKLEVLELLYRQFMADSDGRHSGSGSREVTERMQAFAQYCREEGDTLERFALFLALAEHFERQDPAPRTWREWPVEYRHPNGPAVAEFQQRHRDRIQFYQYVQWQAHEQLAAVFRSTKDLGMPIGLYHDFALGSDPSGAEGWLLQDWLALEADCGCPPDAFALQGQNWGFPPFNPVSLREQAYGPFIKLLRQNLSRGGALRLDHVMGLFRLFWIPKGQSPTAGAYVEYPYDDLLGILALESHRAKTIVIGEDLGTVPDWIREKLEAVRAFSYRVWYFELHGDGSWKAPDLYPVQSLAVATTHDLPTLSGFWGGDDLHLRERLGLFPSTEARRQAWEARARDKARMLEALRTYGGWDGTVPGTGHQSEFTADLTDAVHRFLARTSSSIVLASLDDWIGERAQTNVPGTVDEYPNWSRKTARPLEEIQHDPVCARLAKLMNQERGRHTAHSPDHSAQTDASHESP